MFDLDDDVKIWLIILLPVILTISIIGSSVSIKKEAFKKGDTLACTTRANDVLLSKSRGSKLLGDGISIIDKENKRYSLLSCDKVEDKMNIFNIFFQNREKKKSLELLLYYKDELEEEQYKKIQDYIKYTKNKFTKETIYNVIQLQLKNLTLVNIAENSGLVKKDQHDI